MQREEVLQLPVELLEGSRGRQELLEDLNELDEQDLVGALETENARKAFWINLYNAESQRLAEKYPLLHRSKLLFFLPAVGVGPMKLSLNAIEHGLLRKGRTSLGFGLPGFLREKLGRKLQVSWVDPRVHFALNCASKSCPPIRHYREDELDDQLDLAVSSYLSQEIRDGGEILHVPRMFKWFERDFGGRKGVKEFIESHSEYEASGKTIAFSGFDWSRSLDDFAD